MKHWDFILLDLLLLQAAFITAYIIRHGSVNPYRMSLYRNMAVIIELVDFLWILMFDIYNNTLQRKIPKEFVMILNQVFGIFMGMTAWLFMTQQGEQYSRSVLCITGIIYIILNIPSRMILKNVVKNKNKKAKNVSLIIVTTTGKAAEVIRDVEEHNNRGYVITGIIPLDHTECLEYQDPIVTPSIQGIPIVSDTAHAADYLQKAWVDELLIDASDLTFPAGLKEQAMLMGIAVHSRIPGTLDTDSGTNFIQRVGTQTVFTSTINAMSIMEAFIKRTVDIVGSIIGCLFTAILFLFVAPAIYIQSPGPVIFTQTRVGYNGKRFKIYKFRSMYLDAEDRKKELMDQNKIEGPMFKMDFDPRVIGNHVNANGKQVTGIGEFIRRTSIDEFPQFFNVLKGDMSLVGTRPPTVEEVEAYDLHHKSRLSTKPGITGLWQISGRSNILNFEDVVELDNEYIRSWSLGLDLKILLKTVKIVLKKSGSV